MNASQVETATDTIPASDAAGESPVTHAAPYTPVFTVLDPLRAVGALAVVVTHVTFWSGDYLRHGVIGTAFARLDVGVAIFFVLSGFLLSHHFLARPYHGRRGESTGRYFWKRVLRIYPAYLIAAVLAMVFVEANAGSGVRDWIKVLTMSDIYASSRHRDGLTQMWSLATEVSFYVVLPLLMAAVTWRRRPTERGVLGLVGLMVAANVVWTLWGLGVLDERLDTGLLVNWLPSYLMWFAAGIALAWAHIRLADGHDSAWIRPLVALGRAPGVSWTLAGALLFVSATPLAGPSMLADPSPEQALTKQVLYTFIGALLVVTGVFNDPSSRYSRFMSHPLPRRLGHISYGVFCLHLVVLHFVLWVTPYEIFVGTNGPQILVLTLLITLPLSELLYRFIESPAMRLRNIGRRERRERRGARARY